MLHNTRHGPLSNQQSKVKLTRPRKRKHVTLIAAFRCALHGGQKAVAICADTQETRGDFRVPVRKLSIQECGNYQLVVGGAGELGDLIDDFSESLGWATSAWDASLSEQVIRLKIKRLLIDFNKNEVANYPPPYEKLLEFVICLKGKCSPDIHLWKTSGTGLRVVTDFALVGIGEDFYKPQAERLYRSGLSMPQAFLLGTYLLLQAKETINSIGGPIQSIGVTENEMFLVSPSLVQDLEGRVSTFNEALTQIVLACPDVSMYPDEFNNLLESFSERVMKLRAHYLGQAATTLLDRTLNEPDYTSDHYPTVPPGQLIARGPDGTPEVLSQEETQIFLNELQSAVTPLPESEEESQPSEPETSTDRQ
jgi:hypothetical protein